MQNLNCGNIAVSTLTRPPKFSIQELTLRLLSLEKRVGELEEVAEEKKADSVQCPRN